MPGWLTFGEIEREGERGENLGHARANGNFGRVGFWGIGHLRGSRAVAAVTQISSAKIGENFMAKPEIRQVNDYNYTSSGKIEAVRLL